jgi:hypothetical protein
LAWDSSVAALLLKQQGFEVVGAYMKNWINEDEVPGQCPWRQDIEDARADLFDILGVEIVGHWFPLWRSMMYEPRNLSTSGYLLRRCRPYTCNWYGSMYLMFLVVL